MLYFDINLERFCWGKIRLRCFQTGAKEHTEYDANLDCVFSDFEICLTSNKEVLTNNVAKKGGGVG